MAEAVAAAEETMDQEWEWVAVDSDHRVGGCLQVLQGLLISFILVEQCFQEKSMTSVWPVSLPCRSIWLLKRFR